MCKKSIKPTHIDKCQTFFSNFSNKIVLYPYVHESECRRFPFHMGDGGGGGRDCFSFFRPLIRPLCVSPPDSSKQGIRIFHMAVFVLVVLNFEPKLHTNIFGMSANHGGEGKFKNENGF